MPNHLMQCPICSAGMQVDSLHAGQQLACPTCQNPLQIPDDLSSFPLVDEAQTPTETTVSEISANCPNCLKQFAVTAEMAGTQVACPFCTSVVTLPGPAANQTADVAPIAPANSIAEQAEVDKAELFAPGFYASTADAAPAEPVAESTPVAAADATPPATDGYAVEANFNEEGEPAQAELADSTDLRPEFQLSLVEHPLLPPKFVSSSDTAFTTPLSTDNSKFYLPDPERGVAEYDRNYVGIQTRAGRVVIRTTSKEKKEFRRTLRNSMIFTICMVILIVVFFLLMRGEV